MLVSCSATKSSDAELVAAIERYQGTIYKVIKKARRERYWSSNIDLFIVSARYGLISEYELIEFYEQKMTKDRAMSLQFVVGEVLDNLLDENCYSRIFINLGKNYVLSVQESNRLNLAYEARIVQVASGGIGMRLNQTKTWIVDQHNLESEKPENVY
jgi:cytoplasmic iron level regulating protein YaaA (DUF328/UPF0246 family)